MIKVKYEVLEKIFDSEKVVDFYINGKMITIEDKNKLNDYKKEKDIRLHIAYIRYLKNKHHIYK